ncbi:MAG: hypothetical protein L6437_01345, partial [Kiritimatiellae bacterium]|nr:hypothetical protein [Kiritimatiellia bacterium]
ERVVVVFQDRQSKERAQPFFISEFGLSAKPHVVLAEFWHIATYPVAAIYDYPELMFVAPKDDADKKGIA